MEVGALEKIMEHLRQPFFYYRATGEQVDEEAANESEEEQLGPLDLDQFNTFIPGGSDVFNLDNNISFPGNEPKEDEQVEELELEDNETQDEVIGEELNGSLEE